jgi:protein-S-isoprenylcysteine O-methyltransferase Ste14
VQKERGQKVVTTGPYRIVRHPMYAAGSMFNFATALLLGSWYGVLGALIITLMLAGRSIGEEKMLKEELEGYTDYVEKVRYRLIPFLW